MQSFAQAFYSISCLRDEAHEANLELRFVPVISRAFSPKLISSVERNEHSLIIYVCMTSLYGYNGILPDYFSDEILHEPNSGLKEFLDIFNHRQFELISDIWAKYQFFCENTLDAERKRNQEMDCVLLSLGGTGVNELPDSPLFVRGLKRYLVGLFQRREKTPRGLVFLIQSFFGSLDVEIDQHTISYRTIPVDQRTELGGGTSMLGAQGNFLCGVKMEDSDGGFSLNIKDLDLVTFNRFLPGEESWVELKELLKEYTSDQWDCSLSLELRADEVPKWELGRMRLGADSWALSDQAIENARVSTGKIGGDWK